MPDTVWNVETKQWRADRSGVYDAYTVENLQNLDAVLLEANHDIHMLEVGAYPYPLKQRILGEKRAFSNELSGRLPL